MWNIPNTISISRIAVGPLVIWLLQLPGHAQILAAISLVLVIVAEISDYVDGYLARRMQQHTPLGQLLDPMADSLYRFLVFLAFMERGLVSVWVVVILFVRDLSVAYLRAFAQQRHVTMGARWSGKLKAVVQSIGIITVLSLEMVAPFLQRFLGDIIPTLVSILLVDIPPIIMWVVAGVTAYSGLDYWMSFRKNLNHRQA